MKIINDFSNSLLHRREVRLSVSSVNNPQVGEVRKELAGHLSVSEDQIVVKRLSNLFGSHDFIVDAFVYSSAESKGKFEPKVKQKKTAGGTA